jgi:tryptophan synthase alpha chain
MSVARVRAAFAAAAAAGRAAFVPYLTAGYPDAERAFAAGRVLARHADLMEVGLPYSDPLGDGPTIQRASEAALAAGATTRGTFELVRRLRAATEVPLALMTYYNPVYAYRGPAGTGEGAFVADARAAGVDALILPDLPPDEGATLIAAARAADLATVFLVAPTSTDARLELVTAACTGFVYAVSITGVTGARDDVPAEVAGLVARTRRAGGLPVAVGFGVANAAIAARVAALADGVVVGSALVERVGRMGRPDDVAELDAFAAELAGAMERAGQSPRSETIGPSAR